MSGPSAVLARVTALVVNYNSGPWLERCLRTLRGRSSDLPAIVVVDNASDDGSAEAAEAHTNLVLDRSRENLGFARGINRAAARAQTDYLLILNPDCLLVADGIVRLVGELDAHPDAALVAGRVFGTSGNEQRGSRRRLPNPRRILREMMPLISDGGVDQTHQPCEPGPHEVEAVSGACMMVRRTAFEALGGLDEGYPMHFEDLDFMARLAAAGWRIRLVPEVIASHAGGVSSRSRPVAVLWSKYRGLWRYLSRHCAGSWPAWQRPLWAMLILVHGIVMTPLAWIRRR